MPKPCFRADDFGDGIPKVSLILEYRHRGADSADTLSVV